jgi:hypothetical protein
VSVRGVLVLLLVLAAALAAVFWWDRPPSSSKDGKSADLGKILDGPLDAATAVEIGGGTPACRIERRGKNAWAMVKPLPAEADPRQVEGFLQALADARLVKLVQERARDLGEFGLGESATIVRVEGGKSGKPRVVRIGRHSPVGSERYVSLDDGRVLLADLGAVAPERAPDSFRERRVFPVDPETIRRIAVHRPSGRLVLARDGVSWRVIEPVRDLAEFAAADGLARSLSTISFARVPGEASATDAAPGKPDVEIAVAVETGGASLEEEFARADAHDQRPARRGGTAWDGAVAASDVSELVRDAGEFRERRPLLFSTPDVRGMRIEGSGIRLLARRSREGSAWSLREGNDPAGDVDGAKLDEVLDRIRWIRADRVLDAPEHPFVPALTIEIEGEGAPLGRLELDRVPPAAAESGPGAAPGEPVRMRSSTRPGCVFEVPVFQLAGLPRRRADLALPGAGVGGGRKP